MDFIPVDVCLRLEFVMHKVISGVLFLIGTEGSKTLKNGRRVGKSTEVKQKRKAVKKQFVIETYYRIDKEDNMRPHKIANLIKEYMEERNQVAPSITTIKRYLKEESLI